jgi:hypothetical protein
MNTRGWVVSANYPMAEVIEQKVEDILVTRAGERRVLRSDNLQVGEFAFSRDEFKFQHWNGSWFQLKSAENPNSMHAQALDWVIVDEAGSVPFVLYDTRLVPRLVDSGGWMFCAGTLEERTGEWFEEYYEIGQQENDFGIESWKHPTYDNYHLYTAKGGEKAKDVADYYFISESRLLEMNPDISFPLQPGQLVYIYNVDLKWLEEERKRVDPRVFSARYEAKAAGNQYLVFPTWKTSVFCSEKRASYDPDLPVYLAIDPGGTYAVAAIQLKRFDDISTSNWLTKGLHVCIIDEIYFQTNVTTADVYRECQRREWWGNVWRGAGEDALQGVIDVAAKEQQLTWQQLAVEDELLRKPLYLRSKKVNIDPGNQTLQHYLDTNSFWVNPKCKFYNLEMKRYHFPEPSLQKRETSDPRKSNPVDEWNHLIKAVIYFLVIKYGYYGTGINSAVTYKYRRT